MVNVAVIGARGYLGRECIRVLLNHPEVETITPVSSSEAGKPYGDVVPGFRGRNLRMSSAQDPLVTDADVLFLATDADEARKAVVNARPDQLVIDLSRAHRSEALAGGNRSPWVYGQPELLPVPRGAKRIANPGCYPTATMLAVAPALKAGLAGAGVLISDGISGVSGAGATPRGDLHFPEANEAVRAYKVLGHDHLAEIRLAAHAVEVRAGTTRASPRAVRFTPHLAPFNRGLLATVYLPIKPGATPEDVKAAYAAHYANTPFVHVVAEADTTSVRGSNRAEVAVDVDVDSGLIVARCAIDNLVKGGSGNAIQNMNNALGYPESSGLPLVGGGP